MICILYYIRYINIIINTEFEQDTARAKDKTCEALACQIFLLHQVEPWIDAVDRNVVTTKSNNFQWFLISSIHKLQSSKEKQEM